MGWSSFADRVGHVFGGLWDTAWEGAATVRDLVTIGTEGLTGFDASTLVDESTSTWEALAEQSVLRFHNGIGGIFGPERGVGAALGGLPEGMRSPLRGAVQGSMDLVEHVGRDFIREPLSQLTLAASLSDSDTHRRGRSTWGTLWAADTWERARRLTDDEHTATPMSLGQSLALMATTRDILDPTELARAYGSEWFSFVSGTLDAAAQIFLDPTVLAGKAVKVGLLAAPGRTMVVGGIDSLLEMGGTRARIADRILRSHALGASRDSGYLQRVAQFAEGAELELANDLIARAQRRRVEFRRSGVSMALDPREVTREALDAAPRSRGREFVSFFFGEGDNWARQKDHLRFILAEEERNLLTARSEVHAARLAGLDEAEAAAAAAREETAAAFAKAMEDNDLALAGVSGAWNAAPPRPGDRSPFLGVLEETLRTRGRLERSREFEVTREARLNEKVTGDRLLVEADQKVGTDELPRWMGEQNDRLAALTEDHKVASAELEAEELRVAAYVTMRSETRRLLRGTRTTRREADAVLRPFEAEARKVERLGTMERTSGRLVDERVTPEQVRAGLVLPDLGRSITETRSILEQELDRLGAAETLINASMDAESVRHFANFGEETRSSAAAEVLPGMRAARRRPLTPEEREGLNTGIRSLSEGTPLEGLSEFSTDLGDALARHRARILEMAHYLGAAQEYGIEISADMLRAIREEADRASGVRLGVKLAEVRTAAATDVRAGMDAMVELFDGQIDAINERATLAHRRRAELREERDLIEREANHVRTTMLAVEEATQSLSIERALAAAPRIADALFHRSDAHRDIKALILARTDPARLDDAMDFLMGDADAINRLRDELDSLIKSDEGLREGLSEGMMEDYRRYLVSDKATGSTMENALRVTALIDSLETVFERYGVRRVMQPEHWDAITRWEIQNSAERISQVDAALQFAEREAHFLVPLIGYAQGRAASAAGSMHGMVPKLSTYAAFREGLTRVPGEAARIGQTVTVYDYAGTTRQRVVYNAAAAASRWAYPENPSVARRIVTLPLRGPLTLLDYANARRPPGAVAADALDAPRHLRTMLQSAIHDEHLPQTAADTLVSRFTLARGAERIALWKEAQETAIDAIMKRHGLEDYASQFKDEITRAEAESSRRVQEGAFGAPWTRSTDEDGLQFIDDDAHVNVIEHQILRTQVSNRVYALDFHLINRYAEALAERLEGGQEVSVALKRLRKKDAAVESLESVQRYWKIATLLRPAWASRVVLGDEILRQAVVIGSLAKVGAQVLSNLPELVGRSAALLRDRTGDSEHFGKAYRTAMGGAGMLLAGPVGAAAGVGFAEGSLRLARRIEDAERHGFRWGRDTFIPDGLSSHDDRGRHMREQLTAGRQVEHFVQERGGWRLAKSTEKGKAGAVHPNPSGLRSSKGVMQLEASRHLDQWADVLSNQFGQDASMQVLIKSRLAGRPNPVADLRRWMLDTTQGRRYLDEIGRLGRQGKTLDAWVMQHIDDRINMLDDYVGLGDGSTPIMQAMQDGTLTPQLLEEHFPDVDARPVIHGRLVEQTFGTDMVRKAINNTVSTLMELWASLPSDVLSREPMFRRYYTRDVRRQLIDRGFAPGSNVPTEVLDEVVQSAREYALHQARHLLYDVSDSTRLHHLVRFLVPFGPAIQEAASRWLGLAMEHPDRVATVYAAWDAAWDNAEVIDYGDSQERVFVLHAPAAVARAITGLFGGGAAAGALSSQGAIRIPAGAFATNPISGGVDSIVNLGVGPLAALPAAGIARMRPDIAESRMFRQLFPFGVPDNAVEALAPGWLKQLRPQWFDRDRWERTVLGITQTRITRMELGEEDQIDWGNPEEVAAFHESVQQEAEAFHWLTGLANSASIAPIQFTSPFATQIEDLRQLREKYKGQPGGQALAEAEFYDKVGPQYFALFERFSQNLKGVPTTMQGFADYERLQGLVDANPRVAAFIMARDDSVDVPEVTYSSAVRDWAARQIDPATGEAFYEVKTPQEFATGARESAGWVAYQRMQAAVDAELDRRDLANLNAAGAEQIAVMRRNAIDMIAQRYPEWFADYMEDNSVARAERREQFRDVVARAAEFDMEGRTDVQSVATYLSLRDAVVLELRRRRADGGYGTLEAQGNLPLRRAIEGMVEQMRQADPAFAAVFSRYFERDLLDATYADEVGDEPATEEEAA